jgi:hypothetical protein
MHNERAFWTGDSWQIRDRSNHLLYQDYAYTLSFEVEKHEPNDFIKAEIRKNLNDYRDDF